MGSCGLRRSFKYIIRGKQATLTLCHLAGLQTTHETRDNNAPRYRGTSATHLHEPTGACRECYASVAAGAATQYSTCRRSKPPYSMNERNPALSYALSRSSSSSCSGDAGSRRPSHSSVALSIYDAGSPQNQENSRVVKNNNKITTLFPSLLQLLPIAPATASQPSTFASGLAQSQTHSCCLLTAWCGSSLPHPTGTLSLDRAGLFRPTVVLCYICV